jgi:hypothetical protein
MAVAPAWAAADPPPLVDSTFAGGSGTNAWVVEPGVVRIKPSGGVSESFDASALPAGWEAPAWTTGGIATFSGGSVTVDGARVDPPTMYSAPQTLEFRATFGRDPNTAGTDPDALQNVGFGDTFGDVPWAMFSSGGFSVPAQFSARARAKATMTSELPVPLTVNALVAHTYRIEWAANEVRYYIDDDSNPIATQPIGIADQMRPVISDATVGGGTVKVEWLASGSFTSGTFVSRALQADSAHTLWGNLTSTGSGVTFETRTGNDGSTWSGWQAVGSSGEIQSAAGKFIQYRATLTGATARLASVSISYAIDNDAPSASIGGVQVSGTTARVAFSSPAADVVRFMCSLDGAAPVVCTSPAEFSGLVPGGHSVSVQAVDKADNVGQPASQGFNIDGPRSSNIGQSAARDTTAPKVTFVVTSLRASKRGTVGVKVGCPATETSCKITVQLMRGKTVAAKKTVTVKGGKTKTVTLQLTKAIRRQLSSHHSLKVTAVLSAKDAAGNKKTTKKSLTLRG